MRDAHTHLALTPAQRADLPLAGIDRAMTMMDEAGVGVAIALAMTSAPAEQELLLAATRDLRSRFIPFHWVDPRRPGAAGDLERGLDGGMRGLKLHPIADDFDLADLSVVDPLMEVAAGRGIHVIVHCTSDDRRVDVAKVAGLAQRYPGATVQLAHMGAIWDSSAAIAAAARVPNLYLDTCTASFNAVRRAVVAVPDKVLLGTDYPFYTYALEAAKVAAACEHADAPSAFDAITGGTLARLLEIEDREETDTHADH
jgi:uncharacterized protein